MSNMIFRLKYRPFAIEKRETDKKFFVELIVILDIFQPKNHIWHININFIFLAVSLLSIAKGPYYIHDKIGKGAYKLRTLNGKVLEASHNIKHIKEYYV